MTAETLYTIGHSNHTEDVFLSLLAAQGVSAVADVRSQPFSQYTPQYNKDALASILGDADIQYVFLGRELGARRHEEACYVDGRAKYERVALQPLFQTGLERLFQGMTRYRVSLLCSEGDPIACHRAILVCREIKKQRPVLPIQHILPDGATETHEALEERLVALHGLQPELFGDLTTLPGLVEKAYALQASKLEYQPGEATP